MMNGLPSELESTEVSEVVLPAQSTSQLPLGTVAEAKCSFQDIDSESASSDDQDQDWEAVVAAAEAAFTDEKVDDMIEYLKERGLFAFVKRYIEAEQIPISRLLLIFGVMIPIDTPLNDQLRMLKIAASRVLRAREKLPDVNTVDDVVSLLRKSRNVMILSGAGVSTSCGIPDFRSPTGLYARLKEEHWELEDPQEMFDLAFFKEKPQVFYSFAKEIYPSNFVPSPCHRFVRLLELNHQLLRNYTQNIDGLFEKVGVKRMINCHGSFATASCLRCRTGFPGSAIEADVYAQRVPLCPLCSAEDDKKEAAMAMRKKLPEKWKGKGYSTSGFASDSEDEDASDLAREWDGKPLIKPDIVFFGEMLSDEFDKGLLEDREKVDLLIVMGTSLRVSPVSQIVSHIPHSVPQILINRDPVTHANFDVHLLGDGDTIIRYLCSQLGDSYDLSKHFDISHSLHPPRESTLPIPLIPNVNPETIIPERVEGSHVWLFPGANGGRWVDAVRSAFGGATSDDKGSETSGDDEIEGKEKTEEDEEGEEEEEKEKKDGGLPKTLLPVVEGIEKRNGIEQSISSKFPKGGDRLVPLGSRSLPLSSTTTTTTTTTSSYYSSSSASFPSSRSRSRSPMPFDEKSVEQPIDEDESLSKKIRVT